MILNLQQQLCNEQDIEEAIKQKLKAKLSKSIERIKINSAAPKQLSDGSFDCILDEFEDKVKKAVEQQQKEQID